MPANHFSRATSLQAVLGMVQLASWEGICRHHEQLTNLYFDGPEKLDIDVAAFKKEDGHLVLLMVPVLVQNKRQLLRRAIGKGLPIDTWFNRLPAHVDERCAGHYGYTPGQCPYAEYLMSREVHLLVRPTVSRAKAEKEIRFLERYAWF